MGGWQEFAAQEPDLADRVRGLFGAYRHHTMATLRLDGSPRISGTEVTFDAGRLLLGMMSGTRRAADLRRDPRLALHSHCVDPSGTGPGSWAGEAKIAGCAIGCPADSRSPEGSEWFVVDVAEVVLTRLGDPADHLLIESWTSGRGRSVHRR